VLGWTTQRKLNFVDEEFQPTVPDAIVLGAMEGKERSASRSLREALADHFSDGDR